MYVFFNEITIRFDAAFDTVAEFRCGASINAIFLLIHQRIYGMFAAVS